jgi:hypothetical protein
MNFKFTEVSLLTECVVWSITTQCHCDHDKCTRCLGKLTASQMMKSLCYLSWHNYVTIMTRVQFGKRRNCGWILDWLNGCPSLILSGYLGLCLWGKPAWCEVDHLYPSIVGVKNAWSSYPHCPICVYSVVLNEAWIQFTFTVLYPPISSFIKDSNLNAIHFSCINMLVKSTKTNYNNRTE